MKNLMYRCKDVLKNKNGETLTESAVSILLLSILFLTITTMLMTSLKITRESNDKAAKDQQAANLTVFSSDTTDGNITFTSSEFVVDINIKISKSDDDYFVAFAPKEW